MGQQVFETQLLDAVDRSGTQSQFSIEVSHVRTLRSKMQGNARIPKGLIERCSYVPALAVGSALSVRARLVHRFDLRLPPRLGPEIATAHDLPPMRFDDEGELPPWFVRGQRDLLGIVVPSAFAAEEMNALLGTERIWRIPYGLPEQFVDVTPASNAFLRSIGIERPFVLHAAGATKRKNLDGLKDAWLQVEAAVPSELQLVLAGPPSPQRDHLFEGMPSALRVGRLPRESVAGVMARASAVVVPSTYEGFGLPALEAMACRVPVVASNRGALPEVCGDAALLVEPDGDSLAAGMLRVLDDSGLRETLTGRGEARAKTFSWDVAADSYRSVWAEVLADI